jgi:4-amino-4-deoxy-L-arabinose transferase-like glycosyltransferase
MRLRGFGPSLVAIAAGGLAIRVAYTLALGRHVPGSGDYEYYHGLANLLADGKGFVHPLILGYTGVSVPTAEHPPLWPLLLSVSSSLGAGSYVAHRLTGCLVGTLAIAVVGLLGRRVGGERVGLIAAGLAALYPTLVAADGSLMSESLYGLLVGTGLLLAYRLMDRPSARTAAALGVAVGLAALTRAEALLLLPLLALPVCLRARGRIPGWGWRFGAACLAAVVVIAPWSVRNWITFDRPVPISINESSVIGGANCAQAYGGQDMGYWRLDCLARRPPRVNEAVQAQRWRSQGLRYARHHVLRLGLVAPVRVLRTWDLWQPRRQADFAEGRNRPVQRIGTAIYFPLLCLAIYGLVVLRGRGAPLVVLVAPALAATISSALGYGVPRFRHAAELAIVVAAAVALEQIAARRGWLRRGRGAAEPDPALGTRA